MRNISISHMTPISYLETFDEYCDSYLVLSHLCIEHPEYLDFMKKSKKFKILDNSAYELEVALEDETVLGIAKEINADIVALPDVWGDATETCKRHLDFLLKHDKAGFKWMAIPQGNNVDSYLKCHEWFKENLSFSKNIELLGVAFMTTALCFHSLTETNKKNVAVNRRMAISFLKRQGLLAPKIHLLGIGNPIELIHYYNDPEVINMDSSCAVSLAKQGKLVTSWGCPRIPNKSYDPLWELTNAEIDLAKDNMSAIRKLASFGENNESM